MRKSVLVLAVVGVFSSICSALPSYIEQGQMTWQRGAAGSTWQEWTFENGSNPSVPDNYYNPYGNPNDPTMFGPVINFTGEDGSVPFQWKSGVWMGDPVMALIQIPNTQEPNPVKYVWFEIKYKMVDMLMPEVSPAGSNFQVERTYLNDALSADGWHVMTIGWTIKPNPNMEWFSFGLWGTGGFLDSVSIDTLCTIPEPASMLIAGLGLGALRLFRKRTK